MAPTTSKRGNLPSASSPKTKAGQNRPPSQGLIPPKLSEAVAPAPEPASEKSFLPRRPRRKREAVSNTYGPSSQETAPNPSSCQRKDLDRGDDPFRCPRPGGRRPRPPKRRISLPHPTVDEGGPHPAQRKTRPRPRSAPRRSHHHHPDPRLRSPGCHSRGSSPRYPP